MGRVELPLPTPEAGVLPLYYIPIFPNWADARIYPEMKILSFIQGKSKKFKTANLFHPIL